MDCVIHLAFSHMEVTEVPSYIPPVGRRIAPGRTKELERKPTVKKAVKGKKKPKGVSKLMKELDLIFSRWVRLSNADQEGFVSCYTCGHTSHYKKMQNGHYISRFYKKYRFDERNCRVQCSMCNMWKSGDIPTFRMKLVEELGLEVVQEMESDYKDLHRLEVGFLEERIAHYTQMIAGLAPERVR